MSKMKQAIERILEAEKLEDGVYEGKVVAARPTKSGLALDIELEDATVSVFVNTTDPERVSQLFTAAKALKVDPFELCDGEEIAESLVDKDVSVRLRVTQTGRFVNLVAKKDDDDEAPRAKSKGKKVNEEEVPVGKKGKLKKEEPEDEPGGKKPGKLKGKKEEPAYSEGDKVKVDGKKYTVESFDADDETLTITDGENSYEVKVADLD